MMFEDGMRTEVRCTKLRQLANFQGPAPSRLPSARSRSAVRRPNTRDYYASQVQLSHWATSFPWLVTRLLQLLDWARGSETPWPK